MAGIPQRTYAGWETGDVQPPLDRLSVLAAKHELSVAWLLSGKGDMQDSDDATALRPDDYDPTDYEQMALDFAFIPNTNVIASAGDGAVVIDEATTDVYAFKRSWMREHGYEAANLRMVRAKGDSMLPAIQDRDTVLVDLSDTKLTTGCIYALYYHGGLHVKRVQRHGETVVAISDNSDIYQPESLPIADFDPDGPNRVVGRVVWSARSH